jgi:hypothetical protein
MLNPPSCMGIFKNKYTWNKILAMSRMTPAMFLALGNLLMVLRNILNFGMPKWTTFFLKLGFLDVIITLMSIIRR